MERFNFLSNKEIGHSITKQQPMEESKNSFKEVKREKSFKASNCSSMLDPNDASVQRLFSCGICFEMYTKELRYPISLNCGHTFCLICIKHLSRKKMSIMCGICRKHTFSDYKRLGKNILLLDILEKNNLLDKDEKKDKSKESSSNGDVLANFSGFNFNDNRNDDEDDDASSVHTTFSFGQNQEFANSFWVSNSELEDFYNTLEHVQSLIFTANHSFMHSIRQYERQLSHIRSEMQTLENSLRQSRRCFQDISQRAVQLLSTVRQAVNEDSSSRNPSGPNDPSSGIPESEHAHDFYDDDELFNYIPSISFSLWNNFDAEDWSDERLQQNFLRRLEGNFIYCYLCTVCFPFYPSMVGQHIRGRRHRGLQSANERQAELQQIGNDNLALDSTSPTPFSISARSRLSLPLFLPGGNASINIHFDADSRFFRNRNTNNTEPESRSRYIPPHIRLANASQSNTNSCTSNTNSSVPSSSMNTNLIETRNTERTRGSGGSSSNDLFDFTAFALLNDDFEETWNWNGMDDLHIYDHQPTAPVTNPRNNHHNSNNSRNRSNHFRENNRSLLTEFNDLQFSSSYIPPWERNIHGLQNFQNNADSHRVRTNNAEHRRRDNSNNRRTRGANNRRTRGANNRPTGGANNRPTGGANNRSRNNHGRTNGSWRG